MRPQIAIYEDTTSDIYKSKGDSALPFYIMANKQTYVMFLRFYHIRSFYKCDSYFSKVELSPFPTFNWSKT